MKEHLIVTASVTGDVAELDRAALEKDLKEAIAQVSEKHRLSMKDAVAEIVVEDDLLGIVVNAEDDDEDEVAMGFDRTVPPD